jgi:hypothetical protein
MIARTQFLSNQTIKKNFMAITVEDKPQFITPVYNDMMFIAASTYASTPYFKMVVKVYHNTALQKTLKYDRWPGGEYIQTDVHRMLEANYSPTIENLVTGEEGGGSLANNFQKAPHTFDFYKVEFTEQIGSAPPLTSGTVTASGYTFNASLKYLDWINFDYTDYDIDISIATKLLTNAPRTLKIREGEAASLSFISLGNKVGKAAVKTYDVQGNLIDNEPVYNNITGFATDTKSLDFMCGPYNLGTGLITANVAKYTVTMYNGSWPASETFTFVIDRECSRHQLFRLHFLNRWGRFDSFTFKGSSKQTINFKRSDYQKFTGNTIDNGGLLSWQNKSYARGTVVFDTEETEQYALSTDWLTEEESTWLQELVGSPAVYWQIDPADSTKTIAVNITDASYEVKKYANKKMFGLNLTMQLAQPNYRQRA